MSVFRYSRSPRDWVMNKKNMVVLFTLFSLLSFLGFQNCARVFGGLGLNRGTSTGNPSVHVSFGSYSQAPLQKNGDVAPAQNLDGVSVIFCFSEVKFKTIEDYQESGDQQRDDEIVKQNSFRAQVVSVSPLGTDLGFMDIPIESYRQIEFLLKGEDCESQKSVQLVNSHGTFSTDSEIRLKFNGNKPINISTEELQMLIVPIVEALSTVNNDSEIKGKIESVIGLIKD